MQEYYYTAHTPAYLVLANDLIARLLSIVAKSYRMSVMALFLCTHWYSRRIVILYMLSTSYQVLANIKMAE